MDHKRIAHYLVLSGVPDSPRQVESVYRPQVEPITDITVINRSNHEPVPKGYVCIEKTPSNHEANLNHGSLASSKFMICIRRGRDKPPLLDIGVWYCDNNERVSPECRVIKQTPSGFSANINNTGTKTYLTFRRSPKITPYNQLVVTDICVILTNKNESPPHAFCLIEKNLNKGLFGSDVYLCYKKSMDRPPHLTYAPVIVDRFPMEDYPNYPLPENLPLFCLPMGATIECWAKNDPRLLPSLSTFILTSDIAQKVYGTLLNFYEEIAPNELSEDELVQIGFVEDTQDKIQMAKASQCNSLQRIKSICIISHWPFFDQFKSFLSFLYKKYLVNPMEGSPFSLEAYVFHFMKSIPFPSPDRPNIMVSLCHSVDDNLYFSQTFDDLPIPSNGASFKKLLLNLGPDNCLHLLLFMLTEQKILLHSLRLSILTELAEALVTMIFPFNWDCPYIPLCPLSLAGVLNAPLPFIVGIYSQYFDYFVEPPSDVVSIDVDTKAIYISESKRVLNLKLLPRKEMRFLKETLDAIHKRLVTANQKAATDLNAKRKFDKQIETDIQEAFLYFMASILKDFHQFLKPITAAPRVGATDPTTLFDFDGFLESRDQNYIEFYRAMTKTQMFTKFIEERSLVSTKNVSLAFFDDCIEKVERYEAMNPRRLSRLNLIDFDDRAKSTKTVFITIPDLMQSSERRYSYPVLGQFDREILHKLQSENSSSCDAGAAGSPMQFGDNPDSIGLGAELYCYAFARRAKHEVIKALKVAQQSSRSPAEWAKCLLANAYGLWFVHFPAYSHLLSSPSSLSSGDDSQPPSVGRIKPLSVAYQVLQRLQSMDFSVPDEFCYRILMILCGIHSQPALAVKVFLDMKKRNVRPNAITYGYYNKAVIDGNWPTDPAKWTKLCNTMRVVLHFQRHIKSTSNQLAPGGGVPDQTGSLNQLDRVTTGGQSGAAVSGKQSTIDPLQKSIAFSDSAGLLILPTVAGPRAALANAKATSLERVLRKRHKSSDSRLNASDEEVARLVQDFKSCRNGNAVPVLESGDSNTLDDSESKSSVATTRDTTSESSVKDTTSDGDDVSENSNTIFSNTFTTPIKEVFNNIDLNFFASKSPLGNSFRSSLKAVKSFTKSRGFSRGTNLHNSDKNLNRIGSLFVTRTTDSPANGNTVDRTPPRLPRSSTLPQSFQEEESLHSTPNASTNEMGFKSPLSGYTSPWTARHSEYVYSTFRTLGGKFSEIKSSLANTSSATGSPVKLNMASVISSRNFFNFKNEEEPVTDKSMDDLLNHFDENSFCMDNYRPLLAEHYSKPLEALKSMTQGEVVFKVEMLSCSICRVCNSILYDEEIMCGWGPDDSNLNTKCIYCNATFVPSLTIYIKDLRNVPDTRPPEPTSVPYLSPLVLRKEFENILNSEGYTSLTRAKFLDDHPIVYWNLLWYYTRLNLPSHISGLALTATSLNSSEVIRFSEEHRHDSSNVSVVCMWDNDKFYETLPIHRQWLRIKNLEPKSENDALANTKNIYLELIGLIIQRNLTKPIQYLISERMKNKTTGSFKTNSIYRELLFLTLSQEPPLLNPDTFDQEYREAFDSLTQKDKESMSQMDGPLPTGAIYCRNLFKPLALLRPTN